MADSEVKKKSSKKFVVFNNQKNILIFSSSSSFESSKANTINSVLQLFGCEFLVSPICKVLTFIDKLGPKKVSV